jgi:hypothetical protein
VPRVARYAADVQAVGLQLWGRVKQAPEARCSVPWFANPAAMPHDLGALLQRAAAGCPHVCGEVAVKALPHRVLLHPQLL